jgi:hypothetical protein
MSAVDNNLDTLEYRVALVDSPWPLVLATAGPKSYHLPRVRIPKWTRPAEGINDALRRDWKLNSLVLTILYTGDERPACAVAETLPSAEASFPANLTLKDIEQLSELELDLSERLSIRTMIAGDASTEGPFSRRGWIKEAQAWIRESVSDPAIEFSGDFRQYNASGTFALLRMGTTDARAYWLKATGEPNRHECALTGELSRLFPERLPRLIAIREDWNAWLTEDAGQSLGDTQDLELLTLAVEALADFQIQSLDHIAHLRAAGCMDRSLSRVQSNLRELFRFLEEAMRLQVSTKVTPVPPARLREIERIVGEACIRMQELCIPCCLVNGDINLHNILFDGRQCRFTDWAEGGIGNPFLTLQQFIQHVVREGEHLDWAPFLCSAFKKKWLAVLEEHQIDRALSLMPLLTIADYLNGRGDWLNSQRRNQPRFQSFARTLARCMDRAAAELVSTEVPRV